MKRACVAMAALLLVSVVAMAAGPTGGPSGTKSPDIRTARDLLSRLSSPAEEECGIGYVMGVYVQQPGVLENGGGALPAMSVQKQIAELVKKAILDAGDDTLDRPANSVVAEILEKEKTKLSEITAEAK